MVSVKQYTFTDVGANHTISAEFEEETTPTVGSIVRIFLKVNNSWVPLFTDNQQP